jgi:O-antigen/teichoic acid export membrane protein
MQPVQNFITAVQGLVVPRASRKAADAARLPGAAGNAAAISLRHQTRQLALGFAGLGVVFILVAWPLIDYVLGHTQKWHDVAPLALPISLQAAVYLTQVPFTAAIRAMHRARLLFAQYVAFSVVSLTGLVIGATTGGLTGAVWGLFAGSFTGLLVMIALYLYAVRSIGTASGVTSDGEVVAPVEAV